MSSRCLFFFLVNGLFKILHWKADIFTKGKIIYKPFKKFQAPKIVVDFCFAKGANKSDRVDLTSVDLT